MKTYTFKVKMLNRKVEVNVSNNPVIVTCIHCPLEVFYDSFKETKELYNWCKTICEGDEHLLYVTVTDYVNSKGVFVEQDTTLCTMNRLLDSSSLKEFLCNSNSDEVL